MWKSVVKEAEPEGKVWNRWGVGVRVWWHEYRFQDLEGSAGEASTGTCVGEGRTGEGGRWLFEKAQCSR